MSSELDNTLDAKDAQISELRRLMKGLLSAYVDACRLDMFYDLDHDTVAEQCQSLLSSKDGGELSEEFRLSRNVCKRALRFSKSVEEDELLEKLFESLDKWERHMKKMGYTF